MENGLSWETFILGVDKTYTYDGSWKAPQRQRQQFYKLRVKRNVGGLLPFRRCSKCLPRTRWPTRKCSLKEQHQRYGHSFTGTEWLLRFPGPVPSGLAGLAFASSHPPLLPVRVVGVTASPCPKEGAICPYTSQVFTPSLPHCDQDKGSTS